MPNSDLLPPLLSKLYENQIAIESAILELELGRAAGLSGNRRYGTGCTRRDRSERRIRQNDPGADSDAGLSRTVAVPRDGSLLAARSAA